MISGVGSWRSSCNLSRYVINHYVKTYNYVRLGILRIGLRPNSLTFIVQMRDNDESNIRNFYDLIQLSANKHLVLKGKGFLL